MLQGFERAGSGKSSADGTPDFTRVLHCTQDNLLRPTGHTLQGSAGVPPAIGARATYQYSPTDGRLSSVSGGGFQPPSPFTYPYLPNSNLISSVTGPAHRVENTYAPDRDVLLAKTNSVGTTVISKYEYTVNALGQRTAVAQTGSAFPAATGWNWGYDSLGQVTTAENLTTPANHRAYAYDTIGNRNKSINGTLDPNDPAATTYTANQLNQYSQISSSVSSVQSVVPLHDADGNMTSGQIPAGTAGLVWDAENRLTTVHITGGDTVHYTYDSQSRRIARTVGTDSTLHVYDAWNLIAEYQNNNLTKTYLWGIDLSGSLQGAGGVGGLLALTSNGATGNETHFPTCDGNDNISEYLDATGTIAAHFEYDPFGSTIINTDTANQFPYRFSTKPIDHATGLHYYGYRYYNSATGRWPSRDPIEEEGGNNLYGCLGNDGINRKDVLGLTISRSQTEYTSMNYILKYYGVVAYTGDSNEAGIAYPVKEGEIQFKRSEKNNKCCAEVIAASALKISIKTVLPSDYGDPTYTDVGAGGYLSITKNGYSSLVAHEMRRVNAYNDANSAFLKPAEKSGTQVTKCGTICRDTYEDAEGELSKYIENLQGEAMNYYVDWIEVNQNAIGSEGANWRDVKRNITFMGNTTTKNVRTFFGYTSIHKWSKINVNWKSSCN